MRLGERVGLERWMWKRGRVVGCGWWGGKRQQQVEEEEEEEEEEERRRAAATSQPQLDETVEWRTDRQTTQRRSKRIRPT